MLLNKELKDIQDTITLLSKLQKYAPDYDTMTDIDKKIEALVSIYSRSTIQKKKASEQANKWNKANPERHREINRKYERNKKGGKVI